MRCLIGLDFGIKYSGISITDPNQIIASPLDTCQTNKLIPFLRNYVENQKVEAFVIGMPLQKDGSTSDIEKNILEFIKDLKKYFHLILYIDKMKDIHLKFHLKLF